MKVIIHKWREVVAAALCFLTITTSPGNGETSDELSDLKEHKQMLMDIENYAYELDDPNKVLFEDINGNTFALDQVSFREMILQNALRQVWNNRFLSWDQLKLELPVIIRQQTEKYRRQSEMIKQRLRIIKEAAENERKALQVKIDKLESGESRGKVDLSSSTGVQVFQDDFQGEVAASSIFNYDKFKKWTVATGDVDLVVDGSNTFIDLDGSTTWGTKDGSRDKAQAGKLESKEAISLQPGEYVLKFSVRGNPYQGNRAKDKDKPNKFKVTLGNVVFMESNEIQMAHGTTWEQKELNFSLKQPVMAKLVFDHTIVTGDWDGLFLDNVQIVKYP